MSEKCPNYEVFICISLEIIQVGNKTEAITMYVNPYAPVNPAMLGIPQQRLAAGFQQQMPQGYQQQFAPMQQILDPLFLLAATFAPVTAER